MSELDYHNDTRVSTKNVAQRPSFIPEQVFQFAKFLGCGAGAVVEARIIGGQTGNHVGVFFDPNALVAEVSRFNGKAAIYLGLNPRNSALLKRQQPNKIFRAKKGMAGTNDDVVCRRWFYIDLDPERSKGAASNEEELRASLDLGKKVAEFLRSKGVSEFVGAISGNGAHLLVKLPDYPNETDINQKLKRLLQYFSTTFSTPTVKLDLVVSDPARIIRCYGTVNIKGDNSPERPWRTAKAFFPGHDLPVYDLLTIFASEIEQFDKKTTKKAKQNGSGTNRNQLRVTGKGDLMTLDIKRLFKDQGLYLRELNEKRHAVICPWSHEHSSEQTDQDSSTVFWEACDGKWPTFHCSHSHCEGRKLEHVIEFYGEETIDSYCSKEYVGGRSRLGEKVVYTKLANEFLHDTGQIHSRGDVLLIRHRDNYFAFNGKAWTILSKDDLKAQIIMHFSRDPLINGKINTSFTNNVLHCLDAICHLNSTIEMPSWLASSGVEGKDFIVFQNGILNTKLFLEGHPRIHAPNTPKLFTTSVLPYDFDPTACAPKWNAFLAEVLPNQDDQAFMQEWFGYNFTPDTTHHRFLLMTGDGENGKSVVTEILVNILGRSNVSTVSLERFGGRFDLFQTYGKLANISSEIGELDKASEGILKAFVSGDYITYEQKNKDTFTAKPSARLTLATNTLPRFADKSSGLWRRMILLPFTVIIPPEKQVKYLAKILLSEEASGIINWALEGLVRLHRQGAFTEPESSVKEKEQYRREVNSSRAFLLEEVEECPGCENSTTTVYQLYRDYCQERGYRPLGESLFGRELRRLYPKTTKEQRGSASSQSRRRVYVGLRILNAPAPLYCLPSSVNVGSSATPADTGQTPDGHRTDTRGNDASS